MSYLREELTDPRDEPCEECTFPEEMEPDGSIILRPCLGCGEKPADMLLRYQKQNKKDQELIEGYRAMVKTIQSDYAKLEHDLKTMRGMGDKAQRYGNELADRNLRLEADIAEAQERIKELEEHVKVMDEFNQDQLKSRNMAIIELNKQHSINKAGFLKYKMVREKDRQIIRELVDFIEALLGTVCNLPEETQAYYEDLFNEAGDAASKARKHLGESDD